MNRVARSMLLAVNPTFMTLCTEFVHQAQLGNMGSIVSVQCAPLFFDHIITVFAHHLLDLPPGDHFAFPSMKPKLKPLLIWGRRDYNASQRHKSKWTEIRLEVMQRCERKRPWREDWPYLHWVKFLMLKPQSRRTVILRLVLYPHPLADLSVSGRNNRNPSPSHVQASVSKTSRMWKKEKMKESRGELLASLPDITYCVCVWERGRESTYMSVYVCDRYSACYTACSGGQLGQRLWVVTSYPLAGKG